MISLMAASVWLKIKCPAKSCKSQKGVVQWYKKGCCDPEKIDTDADVFCTKECKWNNGSRYCCIVNLSWKCSECKSYEGADEDKLAASILKLSAAFMRAGGDRNTIAAIVDKIADKM
eukprot:534021_1